ncbi:MAG: hypothetical protein H7834_03450 [Magnetococcus sp. YQC-9]
MESKSGVVSVTYLEKRREAEPMNGLTEDQEDKLAVSMSGLEQRWNEMAQTIRQQREQIEALSAQSEGQRETVAELEEQVLLLQERIDALEAEKTRVIARIEQLLGRYEE